MVSSPLPPSVEFVTLDVFTKDRFKGNPLAIVNLPAEINITQDIKQSIAKEFNLSETVFLYPARPEDPHRQFDIFMTTEELPFAGHPVIGTAIYLYTNADPAVMSTQPIHLLARAGLIKAQYDLKTGKAEASIPHNIRVHKEPVLWRDVVNAQPMLGRFMAKLNTACPLVSIVKGMSFVLVKLPEVADLAKLDVGGPSIDQGRINWDEGWSSFTGTYYYAISSEDEKRGHFSIRSRMIEPFVGEDPATGSAASTLSAYLALQKGESSRTYSFTIEQGVEMGRHSDIGVKVVLDETGKAVKEVFLSGCAVLVSRGTMRL